MESSAQDKELFLPKEPLDLPRDLPKEIPAHANHGHPVNNHPHHGEDEQYSDVKTLLAWHAPARPYRKRNRDFYVTSSLIVFLVSIILFFFSQYLLIVVVLSFLFVVFVLYTIPPHSVYYRISTEGIRLEDKFYLWQELYDFYFTQKEGVTLLHIRTDSYVAGELILLLGDMDRNHVKSVLIRYLPFREYVRPTFMEKSATWLSTNFPLEKQQNI